MKIKIKSPKIIHKLIKISRAHKAITAVAAAIAVFAIYTGIKAMSGGSAAAQYAVTNAYRGNVIVSVSATGQVSASNEAEVKPKVSGDVIWVGIQNGDEVKRGQALVRLDDTDARKNVASSEISLEEAKLNFQRDSAQSPIDYQNKIKSLEDAKNSLSNEYNDALNAISSAFLDWPAIMTGIEDVLYGDDLGRNSGQWNVSVYKGMSESEKGKDTIAMFADIAERDYKESRAEYDSGFEIFKTITRNAPGADIENLLSKAADASNMIAQAVKSEKNLLDTVVDIAGQEKRTVGSYITSSQTSLGNYLGIANSKVSSLLSAESALESAKDAVIDIENNLMILKINNPTGVNPISLQIEQNSIKQKETSLTDLKAELAYYTVYAPFSGIAAKVNVKKSDSVSSGTSLITLISGEKIIEVSLNEIDAANVAVGQKAMISFDAVDGLTAAGEVEEIDSVGTVSQGVVTYSAKIGFSSDNDKIKPGMSASVSIITNMASDAIIVPSSAVKSQGDSYYVEMFEMPQATSTTLQTLTSSVPVVRRTVETGLSNDMETQIISGLEEGDEVITRMVDSSAAGTASAQKQQTTGIFGVGGTGGTRVLR
ncbi:hypothetical protein A3I34_01675 [Candidatus Jorgensenbacteria bacterium RIFCSPLOWO2_02_FULL_45_12]|uniref:Membrane fusion protein biotin-lipoyl like domain-containing protein n=2 Tax=Candidatus Joergenseniibacteriota TaxID=1752739 RepID=A0A1F6BQ95_9BACT|nr:MAG: Efflux transporter, RND family, MFP subunit [Candidatus Jorgensenbacteria bacterium GW2011_GWA2_45_9]OGG39091.1 MAG: hypothetical protein A3D55_00420 [Candidatus Jorgensenbacteria bacterium RIFCSPHIGHO2_02_FULL_45_20]OGG42748.1 MAG: hypothetical protein A3I34_01675 [Candidatus Jorgensenbacteria bacterium RIFCSPLOWO2_02_FULL_45_12]